MYYSLKFIIVFVPILYFDYNFHYLE